MNAKRTSTGLGHSWTEPPGWREREDTELQRVGIFNEKNWGWDMSGKDMKQPRHRVIKMIRDRQARHKICASQCNTKSRTSCSKCRKWIL